MDAQASCKQGSKQHLHWQGQPAHKQTYSHRTRHRAAIQMPQHWVRELGFDPHHKPRLIFVSGRIHPQLLVQLLIRWQFFLEPATRHVERFVPVLSVALESNVFVTTFLSTECEKCLVKQ